MAKLSLRAEFLYERLQEFAAQGSDELHKAIVECRLAHQHQMREITAHPELGQALARIAKEADGSGDE